MIIPTSLVHQFKTKLANKIMISERIKAVMAAVLEVPVSTIDEQSNHETIDNWISLTHLNLIVALEEEFELTLPDEEIPYMLSFTHIDNVMNKLLAKDENHS